jgi:predicted DNA-binding transcriptional regulator YafY
MQKYIGRRVEIIYLSADGRFTKRTIRVIDVRGGAVRAFCFTSGAPRTFRIANILAARPVARTA